MHVYIACICILAYVNAIRMFIRMYPSDLQYEAVYVKFRWFWSIVGTYNQNIQIFNITSYQHIQTLTGHIGIINSVVASPSQRFLFSSSVDSTIQVIYIPIFSIILVFSTGW